MAEARGRLLALAVSIALGAAAFAAGAQAVDRARIADPSAPVQAAPARMAPARMAAARMAAVQAVPVPAAPAEAASAMPDPALESHLRRLGTELRCLVCQNQSVADSDAALAEDLRMRMRAMLRAGSSDEEIRRFMTARYGDFVLYRPPLQPRTWLLWSGPGLMLIGGLLAWAGSMRRRRTLGDDPASARRHADQGSAHFFEEARS